MADIRQQLDKAERIGVIGSPSSTSELALDILASAVNKKLVGELALFQFMQDGQPHFALGQITEVTLRNVWHEDPTMRSLIRQKGRVDAVSERQDTHQGKMTISAVFKSSNGKYLPSLLGTVPATGTPICVVDDTVLTEILAPYIDQLFYLGNVYGSTPLLPLWFKHFGTGASGAGEAYHLGVFGKTGSGKSTLAKMILMAYAAHKQMSIIILDPQGEFAHGIQNNTPPEKMSDVFSKSLLKSSGREPRLYDLDTILLDRYELFVELLIETGFFNALGFKTQAKAEEMGEYLETFLRASKNVKLSDLNINALAAALEEIDAKLNDVYGTKAGQDRVRSIILRTRTQLHNTSNLQTEMPVKKWQEVASFFTDDGNGRRYSPQQIILSALRGNSVEQPLTVIDLSKRPADVDPTMWEDKIKPLLLERFLSELLSRAEKAYSTGTMLNSLVVLDEAHRLAPGGHITNDRQAIIRAKLVDAVRTTRKYGLGWLFLSQTMASLDNEIIQQLRIFFVGFGLSMGSEYQRLRELVAGQQDSLNLYQRFRDPQSAFDQQTREYSFMTVGPVSPLSFSGTPLFFNAFNKLYSFVKANKLRVQ